MRTLDTVHVPQAKECSLLIVLNFMTIFFASARKAQNLKSKYNAMLTPKKYNSNPIYYTILSKINSYVSLSYLMNLSMIFFFFLIAILQNQNNVIKIFDKKL